MNRYIVGFLVSIAFVPSFSLAMPFGGSISTIMPCQTDGARYAFVGPPIGGPFVWTPSTLTYDFGPPSHSGQWLLGLSGVDFYCVISIEPLIIWPGIDITMMGSSQ